MGFDAPTMLAPFIFPDDDPEKGDGGSCSNCGPDELAEQETRYNKMKSNFGLRQDMMIQNPGLKS